MTVSSAELVSAVAKLNDLTRRKLITWSPVETGGGEDVRFSVSSYCAPYEGSTIRIIEYENRYSRLMHDHPSSPHKPPQYRLEILNDRGIAIFVFPDVQGVSDLFSSIRARTGDAEQIIRSLLSAK
jgi:hypothetical protein